MGLFELLRALSFLNSTVFTFLLFFWLAPGYEGATEVFGWCHGCLWIVLSLLSIVAVRRRVIPFWLAVVVAVIFDGALVQAHERLAANSRDAGAKVEFVTIYHLLIEATLGLTAFEFITRYLRDNDLLPGFVEGYSSIHHDEQRHIGYGVWFLREAVGRDPGLGDRVRQTLRDLLPSVAAALAPPDREGTDWEALGASGDEIREFALSGLTRRLNIVGVPLTSL